MIHSPGILLTVAAFALVIGPLVFVHELGHYLAGRWFGVKIDAFSIGFGKEIAGFTDRRGTRWKFGWLPLGGYVRFAGDMNAVSQPSDEWLRLPPEERAHTFQAQQLWKRAVIVAAGPVTNFLAALLILAGFALAYGEMRTPPKIGSVAPGTAAAAAGLKAGDEVTALDGRAIGTFEDIVHYVTIRPREAVRIDYRRSGAPGSTTATLGARTDSDSFGNTQEVGVLGIVRTAQVRAPISVLAAPVVAVRQTGEILRVMTDTLGQVVTGRRSVRELGGPLRIARVSGEQITLGLPAFVFLIALVSINLGFINLLPVPILDGGHLLFYAIEAVRRRPVGVEAQEWAFRGGLAAILALMLLVTFNDLGAFGLWQNLRGLIG